MILNISPLIPDPFEGNLFFPQRMTPSLAIVREGTLARGVGFSLPVLSCGCGTVRTSGFICYSFQIDKKNRFRAGYLTVSRKSIARGCAFERFFKLF
jgi:hypothetical protein